ncbi:MAG TPA: M1 family aminopeptidase, partial [Pyrinomonadaceae bacterium]
EPSITEQFTRLTLRFTDKTYDEIKGSPQARMSTNGPQAQRARDAYRDNQELLRRRLRSNMELRTLVDLYTPERPGFLVAFVEGRRFQKLVFELDPLGIPDVSPEEVRLTSYGVTDRGDWAAFHLASEYKARTASSDEDHRIFDITRHEIEGAIKGTQLVASDTLTFRPLVKGSRVLPFQLYPSLRVGRVRDDQGRDLQFIQELKGRDADFALIWPEPLEVGKSYKVTVDYQGGEAVLDFGGGNFMLNPSARVSWHPNNYGTQAGDRAVFDMTFRYPKGKTLIGTGAPSGAAAEDGGYAVAKWSSGQTELAVAGFNYGVFKKKELLDKETGYNIEFYANTELTNRQNQASFGDGPRGPQAPGVAPEIRGMSASDGLMSTTGAADSVIADAQNSTRIYNAFFGKLPYTRVAMTQQPAPNFGQAWPTLVYMPYTAFLDATQRLMMTDSVRSATNDFYEYVGPHEVAHQWWGHIIGWKSYRDQWMSEGFAEFSASLWVQAVKGPEKFADFWEKQRRLITEAGPGTRDLKPYTVGPVTQGYRLNSGKTGNVARVMIYPKGAYILHMIRMMMFDRKTGDKRFTEMMQDFVHTHYNQDVSTEDFKRAVEKHMTPEMDLDGNRRLDWFFNEWVYGTEIPSYRFDYAVNGDTLTGKVTQSGVSDGFAMLVPVYVDLGKGWVRLGAATIRGNSSTDLGQIKLPQTPKRVAIAPFKDVLALGVENVKGK